MSAADEAGSPADPTPAPGAADAPEAIAAPAAPRSVRRSLASIVLGFETIVVFLAALVIWGLAPTENGTWGLPPWVALAAGGVIILLLLLTIALLRFRWAYGLGWAIQAVVLAAGLLNPAMYVVGALFGGMWIYCMIVGARIDREQAAAAAGKEPT
ncbi:DUF4233 domain-containing protein [Agromyces sp. MMS24-K17]|uniref:DUF4233 domain-containing protein n=1 Tax=Agromyces sp. MMS24-K17 TaxID=3372850 RepID=UPI0037542FA7